MEALKAKPSQDHDAHLSGLSWSAVLGGAFVTAALSLILLSLGAGLGLSSVSPWTNTGVTSSTFSALAVIWLIVTQILSSSMGGYLAGRLRVRWESIHGDEVHFRDTANGLLVWAVAVVITSAFLATATTSMVGGSTKKELSGSRVSDSSGDESYFIDRLFRTDHGTASSSNDSVRREVSRIFYRSVPQGELTKADLGYVTQIIVANAGIAENEATKRITDTLSDAREAADKVRAATSHMLLWIFLALLIGAFCASYAATIGGRQRDKIVRM